MIIITTTELKLLDSNFTGESFDGSDFFNIDGELLKLQRYRFAVDKDHCYIFCLDINDMEKIVELVDTSAIRLLVENKEYVNMHEEDDKYGDLLYPAIKSVTGLDYDMLYVNAFDTLITYIMNKIEKEESRYNLCRVVKG